MEAIKPIEQAYARAQLGAVVHELCKAKPGKRNKALHAAARKLGSIVARGWLTKELAIQGLIKASTQNGLMDIDGERAVLATIGDGLNIGAKTPHADLADKLADSDLIWVSQQRRRIFKTIEEASELIGAKEIASRCGMKALNVRFLLWKMVKAGTVQRRGPGRYASR